VLDSNPLARTTPTVKRADRGPTCLIAAVALAAIALAATTGLAQDADAGPEPCPDEGDTEQEEDFEIPEGFEFDEDSSYETVVRDYRLCPTDESTGFGETIDVSDETRSASSVSDVVSEAVGVQVRRLGGLGSYGAASIRGSTSGQVPVYLDGVLLNAGGFQSVNLGDLNLDTLDSIEVYRGSVPLQLGQAGIGGAISLKSRSFERPVSEIALTYGSWNTAQLVLLHGNRVGEIGALMIVTADGSEGDFLYLNRNGTLFNEDDDRIQRRRNNQHLAYGSLIKLDGPIGDWRWTAANDLHLLQRGVPGIDSVPTENTRLNTLRDAVSLRVGGPLGDPDARLQLDASYLILDEEFTDLLNEIGTGYQHTFSRADTAGGGAMLELDLAERHASTVSLSAFHDRYRYEERVLGIEPDASTRLRLGLGLQHEWQIVDPLTVVPALRLDLHHSDFAGGRLAGDIYEAPPETDTDFFWSPALGLRWEIVPGLFARTNVGRYVRPPDLSELYGDRGAVVGNPQLDAEVGINADAGLTWIYTGEGTVTFARLSGAWFGSWVEDLIAYVQNSQNTIRPENVEGARILGAEASFRLGLLELLSFEGNYTYLNAINISDKPYHDGKYLPGRPAHEAYGKIEAGHTGEIWGAALWLDADYAAENYLDQANLKHDALSRLLFGVGYRLERPQQGLTLTLEVRNVFDKYVLKDEDGRLHPLRDYEAFPLPGRTILLTLHWTMHHD
jgi:iron complex outermembrane receptor protein